MAEDPIARARQEVAATRARIDSHLVDLSASIPDRDDVVATAVRVGAAVGATIVAVAGLVMLGRRRGAAKARRSDGLAYAQALVAALPEVAEAFVASRGGLSASTAGNSRPRERGADGASRATEPGRPRAGHNSGDDGAGAKAVTTGLLVVGAVAGLALSRRRG